MKIKNFYRSVLALVVRWWPPEKIAWREKGKNRESVAKPTRPQAVRCGGGHRSRREDGRPGNAEKRTGWLRAEKKKGPA